MTVLHHEIPHSIVSNKKKRITKILCTAGHAAIVGGSRPSEKKRAGHEPSVNVIREAGGIFAPISGPMECCDDEAIREEEEFYGSHRLQREGISQADREPVSSPLLEWWQKTRPLLNRALVTTLVEKVLTMGRCRTTGVSQAISSQTRSWRSLPTTQY